MAIAWSPANAEGDRQRIDIPSADLSSAIARLSREAGVSIGTDGVLPHIRSRAVKGALSVGDALNVLLAGTGYRAHRVGPTAWRIERVPPRAPAASRPELRPGQAAEAVGEPIIVTAAK
ncbi:MAG TPA: STN domain-containing protein, partial [Devosia sp.]|nr:STN domain-containing protein [Devosia sp.]